MAHFAKLDENNNVLFVTPLEDSICNDDEATGIAYLTKVHNWPYWRKTSYNTYEGKHYTEGVLSEDQSKAYRANYAGVGMKYDPELDIFKRKNKPHQSWTLNTTTGMYEAPVAKPEYSDDKPKGHSWNEETQTWDEIE